MFMDRKALIWYMEAAAMLDSVSHGTRFQVLSLHIDLA